MSREAKDGLWTLPRLLEKPAAFPQALGKRCAFPAGPTAPATSTGTFLTSYERGHF